jgi:tetratricopeptide (TPR) repeat protein
MLAKRSIAILYRKLGHHAEAQQRAYTNFTAYRTRFGPNHEHTLAAMMSLSNALREAFELDEALKIGNDALERYREHFSQHPFANVCEVNFAIVLRRLGRAEEARERNDRALERLSGTLGEAHPYTLCCAANLSNDLAALSDHAAATELSANTLTLSQEIRGPHHPYTLACANNHAIDLDRTGEGAKGQQLAAETLILLSDRLGMKHPDVISARDGVRLECDIEPPPT